MQSADTIHHTSDDGPRNRLRNKQNIRVDCFGDLSVLASILIMTHDDWQRAEAFGRTYGSINIAVITIRSRLPSLQLVPNCVEQLDIALMRVFSERRDECLKGVQRSPQLARHLYDEN